MHPLPRRAFLGTAAAFAGAAPLAAAEKTSDLPDSSQLGKTPHTKFAANIEMWWTKLPVLDRIRQAAALGYPAIEFWPYEGKDLDAMARLCRESNIEIAQFTAWGFRPGLNDPANHDAFVRKVREACQVAKRLRCG